LNKSKLSYEITLFNSFYWLGHKDLSKNFIHAPHKR
jgi:hypothetical protein